LQIGRANIAAELDGRFDPGSFRLLQAAREGAEWNAVAVRFGRPLNGVLVAMPKIDDALPLLVLVSAASDHRALHQ
jgi:hypothetical protein